MRLIATAQLLQHRRMVGEAFRPVPAQPGTRGIEHEKRAAIGHRIVPGRRCCYLQRVVYLYEHHLAASGKTRHPSTVLLPQATEITDQKHQAARAHEIDQMPSSGRQRPEPGPVRRHRRRPVVHTGELSQAVEQRQQGTGARGWPILDTPVLVEHHTADPVALVDRGPGKQCRRLRSDHGFESHAGAKTHPRPAIDQQPYRPLALFAKQLDVCDRRARRHTPVHVARIIAGLVDARLVELHATTAETRQMSAAARRQHLAPWRDLQASGLLAQGDQ